jgi:hypothetical protein
MAPQTTAKIIATVEPKVWSGRPAKGTGKLFFGSGFLTFIVCMFLLIPVPPLRSVGAVIMVCTLVALAITIGKIAFIVRRQWRVLTGLTATINEFIVESTGDESSRITVDTFRFLLNDIGKVPLSINGVPCLELKAAGDRSATRQIVATVTAPDYGLHSFDQLLQEELKRKH